MENFESTNKIWTEPKQRSQWKLKMSVILK